MVAIVVTIFAPALAMPAQSSPLDNKAMGCIVGGMMTASCLSYAEYAAGACALIGGDRGSCFIFGGTVYIACLIGGLLGII
jgi:hypothetical protein